MAETTETLPCHVATKELPGFEGPEKKIEIDFKGVLADPLGLRAVSSERWQDMLNEANCSIINRTTNDYFDAFVLSESSLFVYPSKVIIKTCGTTTLLKCIPKCMAIAAEHSLSPGLVYFSRKNLQWPHHQPFPHTSFDQELEYLDNVFDDGCGYVMGPLDQDRWHLYLADYNNHEDGAVAEPDQTIEICMHELDHEAMQPYFKTFHEDPSVSVATVSGIRTLIPGSIIDEFMFDPCGYSMNGMLDQYYWTIHITPEDHCSYVSFETNLPQSSIPYMELVSRIVALFKPGKFTLSLFADNHALEGTTHEVVDGEFPGYKRKNNTFYEFEGEYNITVGQYVALK